MGIQQQTQPGSIAYSDVGEVKRISEKNISVIER